MGGSLRDVLDLDGEVDPDHLRRILSGQVPHSGQYLISAMGSSGRARQRADNRRAGALGGAEIVDTARAAAALGVSTRYVRMLLSAGDRLRTAQATAGPEDVVEEPRRFLLEDKVEGGAGGAAWRIPRRELDRVLGSKSAQKPRPGYDVTLRPPKSVSVLWVLADHSTRTEIREAHAEAVDEVVHYWEPRAVRARLSGKRGRYLAREAERLRCRKLRGAE